MYMLLNWFIIFDIMTCTFLGLAAKYYTCMYTLQNNERKTQYRQYSMTVSVLTWKVQTMDRIGYFVVFEIL